MCTGLPPKSFAIFIVLLRVETCARAAAKALSVFSFWRMQVVHFTCQINSVVAYAAIVIMSFSRCFLKASSPAVGKLDSNRFKQALMCRGHGPLSASCVEISHSTKNHFHTWVILMTYNASTSARGRFLASVRALRLRPLLSLAFFYAPFESDAYAPVREQMYLPLRGLAWANATLINAHTAKRQLPA